MSLSTSYLEAAGKAGISYTPFVTINGNIPENPVNPQYMELMIRLLMLEDTQYKSCPPQVIQSGTTYQATIETDKGNIVVELYPDKASLSVNSFVFLAKDGWYDNTSFFEIVRDTANDGLQVALAGDHSESGYGSAGYRIGVENTTAKFDKKGLLGLVNGSQFFITYGAQNKLDGKFTVIGEVVEGMDIVEGFPLTTDASGNPVKGVLIKTVTITEK